MKKLIILFSLVSFSALAQFPAVSGGSGSTNYFIGDLSIGGSLFVLTGDVTTLTIQNPIQFNGALSVNNTANGLAINGLNAGATITQWQVVYCSSSSTWLLADANGSGTYPARGLAVAAYSNTDPAVILREGTVRNDSWSWTPGGTLYLSETAGALTQTAPSSTVQSVGFALSAHVAYVSFDPTNVVSSGNTTGWVKTTYAFGKISASESGTAYIFPTEEYQVSGGAGSTRSRILPTGGYISNLVVCDYTAVAADITIAFQTNYVTASTTTLPEPADSPLKLTLLGSSVVLTNDATHSIALPDTATIGCIRMTLSTTATVALFGSYEWWHQTQ